MRLLSYSLLAMLVFALAGCDQDIFNLSCRTVGGSYCLHRWEDGKTYYLEDKDHESKNGGGVLGGVVEQIGWNGNYIVAKRRSTFAGDPSGWMIVDVKQRTIKGPYDDQALEKTPEAKEIALLNADKAWADLR